MMKDEKKFLIVFVAKGARVADSVIVEALSEEHARLKFLADHEGASVVTVQVEL